MIQICDSSSLLQGICDCLVFTQFDVRTTESRTIEAFPDGVDDGEVIAGAATDQQIKRTPLLDLDGKRATRSWFNGYFSYISRAVRLLQMTRNIKRKRKKRAQMKSVSAKSTQRNVVRTL